MEGTAEDPVGRGAGGKREREEPVQDPGSPRRCEVQPGGTRLPLHYGCGEASTGRGSRRERGIRVGAPRAQGTGRGAEGGGRGAAPMARINLCFSPRPRSWHPWKRTSGRVSVSFVLSLVVPSARFISSWDRPGRRAKGSGREPANVRRHSLYWLNADMNKQKKNKALRPLVSAPLPFSPLPEFPF